MLNKSYLFILSLFLLNTSCIKKEDCKNTEAHYELRAELKTYFPYHAGQIISFSKYVDSVYSGEISFKIDTQRIYHTEEFRSEECYPPNESTTRILRETAKTYLYNLTEKDKNITLQIIGKYNKSNPDPKYDYSELNIYFNQMSFKYEEISGAIKNSESTPYYLDSIVLYNKHFGQGICLFPKDQERIYFNSSYGIIGFVNQKTKEYLILNN